MRSWSGVFQSVASESELARGEAEAANKEALLLDKTKLVEDEFQVQAGRIAQMARRLDRAGRTSEAASIRALLRKLLSVPVATSSPAWTAATEARSAALVARERAQDILEITAAQRSTATARLARLSKQLEARLADMQPTAAPR
jgi:hypothetical protein